MKETQPVKLWDYEEVYTPSFVFVLVLIPPIAPLFYRYHVTVDSQKLSVGYSYYFNEEIDRATIKNVEVLKYINGLKQFGGWGYRLSFRGETGYISCNGSGLRVTYLQKHNNKERSIVFNCRDPETVRKLLLKTTTIADPSDGT